MTTDKPLPERVGEAASTVRTHLARFCNQIVVAIGDAHGLTLQQTASAFAIAFLKELETAVTYSLAGEAGADRENDKMHDWAILDAFPVIKTMLQQDLTEVQRRIDAANDELRRN